MKKNEGIRICLMFDNPKVPECSEEKHQWQSIEKPMFNYSGWHIDKCIHCGVEVSYDTSD